MKHYKQITHHTNSQYMLTFGIRPCKEYYFCKELIVLQNLEQIIILQTLDNYEKNIFDVNILGGHFSNRK